MIARSFHFHVVHWSFIIWSRVTTQQLAQHVKTKIVQVFTLWSLSVIIFSNIFQSVDNQEKMHARCIVNYEKGISTKKIFPTEVPFPCYNIQSQCRVHAWPVDFLWKLWQMPSCTANYTNLEQNDFDMFCKINCWAVTCDRIWMTKMHSFIKDSPFAKLQF